MHTMFGFFLSFHSHCPILLSSLRSISLRNSSRDNVMLHRRKDALAFRVQRNVPFHFCQWKNTEVACSFSSANTVIFTLKRNSLRVWCSKGDFSKAKWLPQKLKRLARGHSLSTGVCHVLLIRGQKLLQFWSRPSLDPKSLTFKMLAGVNIFVQA